MKYTVLTPIKFNGERFEEGAPIELNDEQAKPLLESKSITGDERLEAAVSSALSTGHAAPSELVAQKFTVAEPRIETITPLR